MSLASATPSLPTRPTIRAPREGAAIVTTIVAASAVFTWAAYVALFLGGIPLGGSMLGLAVVTSNAALGLAGWCNLRRGFATLDAKVEELHDDNRRIVADLQAARIEARREHAHHISLLADGDDLASVTPLHGRRN